MARPEFNKLRSISKQLISYQYPGHSFSIYGIIDFKDKYYWLDNNSRTYKITDWKNFQKDFDSQLLYHILGSRLATKGNFLINIHMEDYRKFLEEPWEKYFDDDDSPIDNFYIDNFELTRLYFAVYAAIREYKDSQKIMWFMYDGDSEYVDVLLFDTLEEIKWYQKKYIDN